MPRTISADGRQIIVPDDATDEEINAIVGPAPRGTSAPPEKPGLLQSALNATGLPAAYHAFTDPETPEEKATGYEGFDTAPGRGIMRIGLGVGRTLKKAGKDYVQAAKEDSPMKAAAVLSNAALGGLPSTAATQAGEGNYSGAAGTILGGTAAFMAPRAIEAAIPVAKAIPGVVGDAATAAKMKLRPSSSPAIVPAMDIQAQKIAQSILPPGGIKPEFLKSIQAEAPAVMEYARRTGNPLNTQAEGLAAARGVAAEGLEHYKTEVLSPVAGRSVALDSATTELGDKANIGDIDSRITKLNKLINTDKAASQGAALDVLAKSKWQDELSYLRGKLYSSLEHTTGIPAEDIQTLREGYGGQYSLADQLESAQNARLTRTGQLSQGQQSISIKRPSILEAPGQIYQAARGGEQAVADRQFSSAMKSVQPKAPVRPTPPPIDVDATTAQRQAAQAEFVRANQLEQGAQDAAAQRGQQASAVRQAGRESWVQSGLQKVTQHINSATNPGLSASELTRVSASPAGRQLLIQASGLTPGSPMMLNIVKQLKDLSGASK